MKIAIIGGGWVGCHLAYKLFKNHQVDIFEKNDELFKETSYKNQNRLHVGFHYARNSKTRLMCLKTFDRFLEDYKFATKEVNKNLYCVPKSTSLIDFDTYLEIFKNFNYDLTDNNFSNVEGCINTHEKYIDFNVISDFFNNTLNFTKKTIFKSDLDLLSQEYDLVVNATNNHLVDNQVEDFFYELTLTLIYEKVHNTFFDSVTFVDGELFSIYPYMEKLYTVTDVEHTPLERFSELDSLNGYKKNNISEELIKNKKKLIEKKINSYYPNFLENFKYHSYFISTKSKIITQSESRQPVINIDGNVISCFTGKIQGIYLIEDYIKDFIYGKKSAS